MKLNKYFKRRGSMIAYTLVVAAMLCTVLLLMINYIYREAEDDGFENLHVQTREIKDDIDLQMISDRENLQTMANFAAKLYSDGESFDLLLNSFESIGLIENIGILLPDGSFMTRLGTLQVSDEISFEAEAKRGTYISGRVTDITHPGNEVIRSAVPIIADSHTIAILYGVIELDAIEERYVSEAAEKEAQLFVLERGNGNFIIDTRHKQLGNVSSLASREYRKNFNYDKLYKDVIEGKSGYSSFVSKFTGEALYIHYAPTEVSDWQIMLAVPEKKVFAEANIANKNLLLMFFLIVLIMLLYLIVMFTAERRGSKLNLVASGIRKILLAINQQSSAVNDALKNIAEFSRSRSAFFVDTDFEDYNYIDPQLKDRLLTGKDRKYFVAELFDHIYLKNKDSFTPVNSFKINADKKLAVRNPEFCEFLKAKKIQKIVFASVTNEKGNICIIGSINSRSDIITKKLLDEIAVCFSMAMHNKKYLNKTELIASTDSLTGLSNRMVYNKDISYLDTEASKQFSCIYVDINELHIINNKYGHSAGDTMLIYISNALKEMFAGNRIYRMGGDEFLVFTENLSEERVKKAVEGFVKKVEAMNYYVSVGMHFSAGNEDIQSVVGKAEKLMYEAKADYYQKKVKGNLIKPRKNQVEHLSTGISGVDSLLSVMSHHYAGVYSVSLENDLVHPILTPSYLKDYHKNEKSFSRLYTHYIHELVDHDHQRQLLSFLEYDALKNQLLNGYTPVMTYTKIDGGRYKLSVHLVSSGNSDTTDTLWVFERED